MARFNQPGTRATARPKAVATGTAVNSEGGSGFALSTLGELYDLAVVNFVGQKTFYESGVDRDDRYNGLVESVATGQWEWLQGMLLWLRSDANMRTASLTAAAHAVHARLAAGEYGRDNDALIDAVIQRGDEIAEFLAYWQLTFGRALPKAVRRGLELAIQRLYTARNVLKWDSSARGLRMADVIEIIHPTPVSAEQAALFKYLLDERHHKDGSAEDIPMILARKAWYAAPDAVKLAGLRDGSAFKQAGLTWENALSELKERLGEGAVWDAVAPHLPYMAALRNLRNMDEAGISGPQARKLADRLADPAEVARSRQLPHRFLTAYSEAPSDRWKQALEEALNLSLLSVPKLPGKTLVLVDTSASMDSLSYSARSKVTPAMAAALFGAVLAQRNPGSVDLYGFADGVFEHKVRRGEGALSAAKALVARIGEKGHGTEMTASVRKTFRGHDRVFMISDMQCFADPAGIGFSDSFRNSDPVPVPDGTKVYGVNLGGNAVTAVDTRVRNRFEFAGLTDAVFGQVLALEAGYDEKWPWLA